MPDFQTFKDLSITFKKHPVSDDLVQVKDKAAIAQSITALLLTRKGERPFQPELGSDIARALFEPLDYGSAAIVRSAITEVLGTYEPRINVSNVQVFVNDGQNGYDVELTYKIIGRADLPRTTVEFFLERTR